MITLLAPARRRKRWLLGHVNGPGSLPSAPVTLIDYDAEPKKNIIASILYSHARHPLMQLREIAAK